MSYPSLTAEVFYYHASESPVQVQVLPEVAETYSSTLSSMWRDWKHATLSLENDGYAVVTFTPELADRTTERYSVSEPGRYAIYMGDLIRIQSNCYLDTSQATLVITDLDDTLLSSKEDGSSSTYRFMRYWISHHLFNRSKLVYSTGRTFVKYLKIFDAHPSLLHPDCVICSSGGEAYFPDSTPGQYRLLTSYSESCKFQAWDSVTVSKIIEDRFPAVKPILGSPDTDLSVLREVSNENRSVYQELKRYLSNKEGRVDYGKCIKAKTLLVVCDGRNFLDLVPVGGGKRTGVDFARSHFGFSADDTLVAGDAANDISMLKGPEHGVITGNCQEELKAWFYRKGCRFNNYLSDRLYADAIVEALAKV